MSEPVKDRAHELKPSSPQSTKTMGTVWLKRTAITEVGDKDARKLLRLLRYLRDDIRRIDAITPMPNAWLLRCIIRCNRGYTKMPNNWLYDVQNFLKSVQTQIDSEKMGLLQFYDITRNHALFPNTDNFSLDDLAHFCQYVLRYLDSLDSKTKIN